MSNKNKSFASLITKFSQQEVDTLQAAAQLCLKKGGMVIKTAPKALEYARLLLIIPKKVGSAPERNLIRRRLKSIFFQEQLYNQALDYLIIVTPYATKYSFEKFKEVLIKASTRDNLPV